MKNFIKKYIKPFSYFAALATLLISSCSKDDYYIDGGKANPSFNGTIMDYLNSNPKFDTIAQIVKLAGLEDVLTNEEVTFFAPTDEVIRRTIGNIRSEHPGLNLNAALFDAGKDTIVTLADVDPELWRKYLMRYIFKGKRVLKDYPQIDFDLLQLYPGGYYWGYNNDLSNIGVVYNDVNSVRYTGYRQLALSFVPDPSSPNRFYTGAVATSDIQPTNGVVHVLAVNWTNGDYRIGRLLMRAESNFFGFGYDFYNDVILSK